MSVLSYLNVVIGADTSDLRRKMDGAAQSVAQAGRRMQSVGRTMSTYVTLPITAIGTATVRMASDAQESANKFETVMGDSADAIRSRLEALRPTLHLTTGEVLGLAAGVQDMLVPMGVARDAAATMSADFVQLAGDLASFNNVPTQRVLEAMQSALAGSSEPMRAFGVDTRVAALEAIALEAGLIQVGEQMDQTAMAQAVLLAVQKDSTDAMGDAARTAGSFANQSKRAFAQIRQLGETIGAILIPALTPLLAKLNSALGFITSLDPSTQTLIVAVAGLAAAAGPLLLALGTIATLLPTITAGFGVLAAVSGPIWLAAAAFASVVAAGVAIVDNWRVISYEVTRMVDQVRDALVGRFGAIVESVREKVEAVTGFFAGMYDAVVGNSYVPDMVEGISYYMVDVLGDTFDRVETRLSETERRIQGMANRGLDAMASFATGSSSALSSFVTSAIAEISRLIARMLVLKAVSAALNFISPGAGTAFTSFLDRRAMGGAVQAGQPYMTGERGVELFVPSESGRIIPNHALAAGGGSDALLAKLAEMPAPMTPREASRDAWWREFAGELIAGDRRRNGA